MYIPNVLEKTSSGEKVYDKLIYEYRGQQHDVRIRSAVDQRNHRPEKTINRSIPVCMDEVDQ